MSPHTNPVHQAHRAVIEQRLAALAHGWRWARFRNEWGWLVDWASRLRVEELEGVCRCGSEVTL